MSSRPSVRAASSSKLQPRRFVSLFIGLTDSRESRRLRQQGRPLSSRFGVSDVATTETPVTCARASYSWQTDQSSTPVQRQSRSDQNLPVADRLLTRLENSATATIMATGINPELGSRAGKRS